VRGNTFFGITLMLMFTEHLRHLLCCPAQTFFFAQIGIRQRLGKEPGAAAQDQIGLLRQVNGTARQGKMLAYPVCGEGFSLTAAVPGPDGWEVGTYGIRTPILSRSAVLPPDKLDLVLVPCTAFDAVCHRVGMGKGYYDRYLPRCTRAVKIGVAFEAQRVDAAAVDAYDEKLDGFVTEGGLYFGFDTTEL